MIFDTLYRAKCETIKRPKGSRSSFDIENMFVYFRLAEPVLIITYKEKYR